MLQSHGPEALHSAGTVVIPPFVAPPIPEEVPAAMAAALASAAPGTRLVSICTGAFALAAAGLLNGRPATTHWVVADLFRDCFPQVALDPDVLFIDDGDVVTSAGGRPSR
ncbi:DJ-1/PfpI family protein [Nonomuraea sp. NPDC049480]|uniref:DJ-1/PfpI family protein n=1 Tax=Nonomuraea sp. NPDC049480 TaxID=3364353 RepID=UPI0037957E5D